jgi:hypothetical protein
MNDIAEAAIIEIFSNWNARKAEVTQHFKDGFDWLPGRHTVRVRYHERESKDGKKQFRVAVMTDYLRSVPIKDQKFVRQAALMADFLFPTCAPVYRPVSQDGALGEMHLCSSMYFDESSAEMLSALLARLTILQPVYAELQSTKAPQMLGGGIAAFADRTGEPTANSAMNVAETTIYPQGAKPNFWIDSGEFERFAAQRQNSSFCHVKADALGMTLAASFGSESAVILFKTDQPHPHHGNGLLIRTEINTSPDLDQVCATAARLNLLEASSWTEFPQLGCWHAEESLKGLFGLAHCCFVPNACFMPELVNGLADWALARVWWARTILRPAEKDLPLREILRTRMRR